MIGIAVLALALAADGPAALSQPTITVLGIGSVETPPDIAVLSISIRGEGKTADDASSDLARRQKAIFDGISSLSPTGVKIETSDVTSRVSRSPACKDNDDDAPLSSTGPYAVTGYVLSSSVTITINSTKDAGTAVGLASRLGAVKAQIESFKLKSPADATNRANAAAFDNARAQASSIAAASGQRLGPVLVVRNDQADVFFNDLTNLPQLRSTSAGLAAPVPIDVKPGAVSTLTRLVVTFALIN